MEMTARPALEIEVEITDAMTTAGVAAWADFQVGDRADWLVDAIYEAMEEARVRPVQPSPWLPQSPLLHSDALRSRCIG